MIGRTKRNLWFRSRAGRVKCSAKGRNYETTTDFSLTRVDGLSRLHDTDGIWSGFRQKAFELYAGGYQRRFRSNSCTHEGGQAGGDEAAASAASGTIRLEQPGGTGRHHV